MPKSQAYKTASRKGGKSGGDGVDLIAEAPIIIDWSAAMVNQGRHFFLTYSVADVGAASTPTDMMTLSWKTPNTTVWEHFAFMAIGTAGAQIRLIEGKTGGGASPTGVLQTYNNNRNSSDASTILDVAGGNASKVSNDATLFTGGLSLLDEYITALGIVTFYSGNKNQGDNKLLMKQNTVY